MKRTPKKSTKIRSNRRSGVGARKQEARIVDIDHERLRTMALELRGDGYSYREIAVEITARLKLAAEAALKAKVASTNGNGNGHVDIGGETAPVEPRTVRKDLARQLVIEAWAEQREENRELADEVKKLELARLDSYLKRLNERKDKDTPRVIDTMLRISESRRRLLGIDAPLDVRHSGTLAVDAVWDLTQLSDHELALLAWLHDKATVKTGEPMPQLPENAPMAALPPGAPVVVVPAPTP